MQKNLNDIIPPSRRRALGEEVPAHTPIPSMYGNSMPIPPTPPLKQKGRGFPYGTALVTLLIIAITAGALYAFAGAKVVITPEMTSAHIAGSFTATSNAGNLPYEVIVVEKLASQSVPAESTETVREAAQGTITITNTQAVPQTLIATTRFATPEGKIFKIRDGITVPASKNGNPGSISVTVYAAEVGDSYNIGPSTFTLPGLQSNAKAYAAVTAKSAGSMTGGFSGERPTVSKATKDKQYAQMQATLSPDIKKALLEKVPEGYVLLEGASVTTITAQPDQAGTGGTAVLSQKASATAVVFPGDLLAKEVAAGALGTYAGQPVHFKNTDGLTLKMDSPTIPTDGSDISFTLTGDADIIWTIDGAKIASAVAGKTRDAAKTILLSFSELKTATVELRPFWVNTFPADPTHIKIIITEPGKAK